MFRTVFVVTEATIISRTVAERVKFLSYIVLSIKVIILYPISGLLLWVVGFLGDLGFINYACSSVLHAAGGLLLYY